MSNRGVLKHISPSLFYFLLLYPTLESRRISFKSLYIPEIESIIAFISSPILVDHHENNCLPSDWSFGLESRDHSGAPGFRRSASSPLEPLSHQITPVSFKMVSGYGTDRRQKDEPRSEVSYLFGHPPGRGVALWISQPGLRIGGMRSQELTLKVSIANRYSIVRPYRSPRCGPGLRLRSQVRLPRSFPRTPDDGL